MQTLHAQQATATLVELDKYEGKWFVIACIPTKFDKDWSYVTETYTLKKNGKIDIYTSYVKAGDPDKKKAKPKQKHLKSKGFPQKNTNNFKWKIQFFWPFKTDYLIEELAKDYSYSVVGHPEKKFLYIMSREKLMSEDLYKDITWRFREKGYDMNKLIKIPQ